MAEDGHDWAARARAELKGRDPETLHRRTEDGIPIKPLYRAADLDDISHLDVPPGFAPFTRGIRATMHAGRPWTIRQYGGFAMAEDTNAFFKANLAAGQTGLSVAFDLPTHRGYDSDHPEAAAEIGRAGVAIDTVEDMARLFDGIDLGSTSVSMTMSGAVLPVLAAFIVAGEEQGVPREKLTGTIQNDILKEFLVRNAYIYPPEPSLRIVGDVVEAVTRAMPRFNALSISGYHMQEAGATPVQEVAYTIADGLDYVRAALARGLDIDAFAPRLSFFFGVGLNFFQEIAKLRAARIVWAERMAAFAPKNPASLALRMHCQTSGVSLVAQEPRNNMMRTTIEALAAVLGGTQSLHTNGFDEALGLPSPEAVRLARNTQHILAEETDLTYVADPLGGSYYVESLTASLAEAIRAEVNRVEVAGGMARFIAGGEARRAIAEAAARRQARIDSGEAAVIGLNRHVDPAAERSGGGPGSIEHGSIEHGSIERGPIDHEAMRQRQIARLDAVRARRDAKAVTAALDRLRVAAAKGPPQPGSNMPGLLELAIDAMRARATVGEVSNALERVFGRHQAPSPLVAGIYGEASTGNTAFATLREAVAALAARLGHAPRLLVVKLGQDGHDRGAGAIAGGFADLGFEVRLAPLFRTPAEAARLALDWPADIIGISSHGGGHGELAPALMQALRTGGGAMPVVCGGVVPEADRPALIQAGIALIFGPGTSVTDAAREVLALL